MLKSYEFVDGLQLVYNGIQVFFCVMIAAEN